MRLFSDNFKQWALIPDECAFAVPAPQIHIALSSNRNPHLAWIDAPSETRSFAIVCKDHQFPQRTEAVNREGRSIQTSFPRTEFVHWILVDIPSHVRSIHEGRHSCGITPRGKPGPDLPGGMRHGINDYTCWFANDQKMSGVYYGYDGPCPPWNDQLLHHYVFTLFALDVARLKVQGELMLDSVERAMKGHVLCAARLTGSYTLNAALRVR